MENNTQSITTLDTQVAFVTNKNSLKAFERSVNVKISQLELAGHKVCTEAIRAYPTPIPEKGEIKLLWLAVVPYLCTPNSVRVNPEFNFSGFQGLNVDPDKLTKEALVFTDDEN